MPLNNFLLFSLIFVLGLLIYFFVLFLYIHRHSKRIERYILKLDQDSQSKPHDLSKFRSFPLNPFRKINFLIEGLAKNYYQSKKLQERHLRDRSHILENIDRGIVALLKNGKVLFLNRKLTKFKEIDPVVAEKAFEEFYLEELCSSKDLFSFLNRKLEEQNMQDEFFTTKESKDLLVSSSILKNSKNENIGKVFFLKTIESKEQVEKLRKQFLSNLSHQIKTPLTNILGYLELLQDSSDLDLQSRNRFIQIAYQQTQELKNLTEQMLLLSKIDSFDSAGIKKASCSLKNITYDAISLHQIFADEKNISFQCQHIEGTNDEVMANRSLLREALGNIISNAIKYSPPQSNIDIICQKAGPKNLSITIKDYGHGISEDEQEKIFERFYRAPKAYLSNFEKGFGLGLPIAHKIISIHQGKIEIESELGRGTSFRVILPQSL